MNTNDIEYFKKKLEEEKALLEEELGDIGRVTNAETGDWDPVPVEVDQSTADENLNADRFESFTERSSTLDTLEARLEEVRAALTRLENGTFGTCEISGEEIERDRLEANPAARTNKANMNEKV